MIARLSQLRASENTRTVSTANKSIGHSPAHHMYRNSIPGDLEVQSPYMADVVKRQLETDKTMTYNNLYSDTLLLPASPRKLLNRDEVFHHLVENIGLIKLKSLNHKQLIEVGEVYCKAIVAMRKGASAHRYYNQAELYKYMLNQLFSLAVRLEYVVGDEAGARFFYEEAAFHGQKQARQYEMPVDADELDKALQKVVALQRYRDR